MVEITEISLPRDINARSLAQELMDTSEIPNSKYFGRDNSGEVVQVDNNGRPYARMFSLRTHQESDRTVVHLTDWTYCASEHLAKKPQVP